MRTETDWREEYRIGRSYAHLTEQQLCGRYVSLLENTVQFDDFGRAFIRRNGLPYWTKRLCWAEEEFRLRSLTARFVELQETELARTRPRVIAAQKLRCAEGLEAGAYIVKFGQRQHVLDMLSKGRFRIAPAASYNLNPALRDDELVTEVWTPWGTRLSVKIEENYQEIPSVFGPLRFSKRCENSMVFARRAKFDPRLFDEFEADACLVVRDLQHFGLRLIRGFAEVAGMTKVAQGSVHYLDPLHPSEPAKIVELTKNFRYEYQQEWRVVWKGERPLAESAAAIFVELGPLTDCCEAWCL